MATGSAASVRKILVDWANDQQSWVRAIVREVLESQSPLPQDVLDDFYQRSLSERDLSDEPIRTEPKLTLEVTKTEAGERLLIISLKNVQGVNSLSENQEIIFNGRITIVFGENASGKTGYVRIFKRGAAVRSAEPVLPNVRAPKEGSPHATITYKLGDMEAIVEWNNEAGIAPLTRISVFDSPAAAFHVDEDSVMGMCLETFPCIRSSAKQFRESGTGWCVRVMPRSHLGTHFCLTSTQNHHSMGS